MRSKTRSVRFPHLVDEWAAARADELGYPSANAYLTWLVVYDVMVRRPHHITQPLARQSLADQDDFLDGLAADVEGDGDRSQLFEEAVKRWINQNPDKAREIADQ